MKPSIPKNRRSAFTLVEIISVMVVMVLILSVAVGAHMMWKRHTALDALTMQIASQLALARQYAITQARPATFTAANSALHPDWDGGVLDFRHDLALDRINSDRGLFLVTVPADTFDDSEPESPPDDPSAPIPDKRSPIGEVIRMPRRVLWSTRPTEARASPVEPMSVATSITFQPDGTCTVDPESDDIVLTFLQDSTPAARTNILMRRSLRINPMTGLARQITDEEAAEKE